MYSLHRRLHESRGSLASPQIQMMLADKLAIDSTVLDPALLGSVMKFLNLACQWWLSLVCPSVKAGIGAAAGAAGSEGTSGLGEVQLPLPETPPPILSVMPQHFVEDVLDMLKFLGSDAPQNKMFFPTFGSSLVPSVLGVTDMKSSFEFVITLMASPQYTHSPHLRAKLIDVLENTFAPLEARHSRGPPPLVTDQCALLFRNSPLGHRYLTAGLIELFGDVEKLPVLAGIDSLLYANTLSCR
jgi:hypothetical protein